jgi:hypothetical protein
MMIMDTIRRRKSTNTAKELIKPMATTRNQTRRKPIKWVFSPSQPQQ